MQSLFDMSFGLHFPCPFHQLNHLIDKNKFRYLWGKALSCNQRMGLIMKIGGVCAFNDYCHLTWGASSSRLLRNLCFSSGLVVRRSWLPTTLPKLSPHKQAAFLLPKALPEIVEDISFWSWDCLLIISWVLLRFCIF